MAAYSYKNTSFDISARGISEDVFFDTLVIYKTKHKHVAEVKTAVAPSPGENDFRIAH